MLSFTLQMVGCGAGKKHGIGEITSSRESKSADSESAKSILLQFKSVTEEEVMLTNNYIIVMKPRYIIEWFRIKLST